MKNKLLILLFEIGFGAYVEYIGQISISEIFLIVFAFTYLTRSLFQSAIIQKLTIIYSVLLLAQFFSEIMSNNSIDNAYKGYAVTIISYLHLMFLSSQFKKNKSLIIYVLIGILLRGFIFGSSKEGSIDEALSGEAAGFLKFYLAPMIMSGLLVLSMLSPRKSMALIFCFVGIALIALGARSMGAAAFIIGIISILSIRRKPIKRKHMWILSIFLVGLMYGMYCLYVNQVKSGEITSGNSEQLLLAANPYNPISLIETGRSEVFVGWIAFMDAPLWGHGAWASDVGGKYNKMIMTMHGDRVVRNYIDVIPSHSVIIGYAVNEGFVPFLCLLYITFLFLKEGVRLVRKVDRKYLFILVYSVIFTFWDSFFSPVSHFRISLPFNYAVILCLHYYYGRYSEQKKRKIKKEDNSLNFREIFNKQKK